MLTLLVGIPVALYAMRGNPLPDSGTDLSGLLDRLTAPDTDGSLFLGALTWIGWLAWASFALSVLLDAVSQLRGLPTPHLPALGPQQRAANVLVAATALLFTVPLLSGAPALATSAVAVSAPLTSPASAPTHEHTRPAPDTASASRTYTVQPGDTLWQIATDQLGDGSRFTEIAQLNYAVAQTDGRALTAAHRLTPGWQLTLPGDAAPAAAPVARTVVVEPGDTLWQIAQDRLGDGDRYPAIAAASTGLQDDGGRLVDPDLIRPGWELTMPSSTPAAAPAAPDARSLLEQPAAPPATAPERPAPAAPETPPTAPVPAAKAPASPAAETSAQAPAAPSPATTPSAQGPESEPDAADDRVTLRTAGGVGALMAAGLLTLLGLKRTRQQRRRRPGQRIAMPPPELQPVEFELRMVEDPTGLARVDQALRSLSVLLAELDQPLPVLRVARLVDEDLELYLDGTTVLPAPFLATGDPSIWTLPADAPLVSAEELDQVAAPFPSLITLGHDLDDGHVLLDLEQAASLAVDGDPTVSVAVLAAIAAELATSRWADDLQVTVVGCLPQLPDAIGTGRVRHVDTLGQVLPALERRAAGIRKLMADSGLSDLQHARSAANQRPHSGAWYPEILLLGGPVDPTDRARLEDLLQDLPRVSIATVTADSNPAEWTLTLDRTDDGPDGVAVLRPLNLALRPQRLSTEDLDQLLGLLAVADLPSQDLPREDPTAPVLVTEEPPLADLGAQLVSSTSIHLVLAPEPTPKEPEATVAASAAAAQDALAPVEPGQVNTAGTAGTAEAVEVVEAGGEPGPPVKRGGEPAPLVQVLGPVTVLHARGRLESDRRNQLTEIAAFLALHPGLDHTHLDEAKWPGARNLTNTRNSAVSKLRRWLGTAADGTEHLPDATAGYRLHPDVRSDWDLWLALLPNGPAGASTEALADALELVKGQPFAGVNKRTYAWAERDKQEMISAIGDAAHELARRALVDGDATLARQAAAAGLQADPGAELLWRDALRAEWLAGDLAGLSSTAARLIDLASKLGDDLEPETDELLDELLLARPRQPTGR
jgi:nucleoid-associated protein YgaU